MLVKVALQTEFLPESCTWTLHMQYKISKLKHENDPSLHISTHHPNQHDRNHFLEGNLGLSEALFEMQKTIHMRGKTYLELN
jgi:hypothetical protein